MRDDGNVSVVTLAALVLCGFCCLAIADAANVLLARSRAQAAADASALAAAADQVVFGPGSDPSAAATTIAERNGARLDSCTCPRGTSDAEVRVSVAVRVRLLRVAPDRVSALARARIDPKRLFLPPGSP